MENFANEDKGIIKLGIPENCKNSPYKDMTLNEFVQAHYMCGNQPIVLQVRGLTLRHWEFMIEMSMAKVAYNWAQHAATDMLWYMSAEAGKAIFGNFETLQLIPTTP
jgi:hypothetical protein